MQNQTTRQFIRSRAPTLIKKSAFRAAEISTGALVVNKIILGALATNPFPSAKPLNITDAVGKAAITGACLDLVIDAYFLTKKQCHDDGMILLGPLPYKYRHGQIIRTNTLFELYSAIIIIALNNTLIACGLPYGFNMALPTAIASVTSGVIMVQVIQRLRIALQNKCIDQYNAIVNPMQNQLPRHHQNANNLRTPLTTQNQEDSQTRRHTCVEKFYENKKSLAEGIMINMLAGTVVAGALFGLAAAAIGSAITRNSYYNTIDKTFWGFIESGGIASIIAHFSGLYSFGPKPQLNTNISMLKYQIFACLFAATASTIGSFQANKTNPITLDQATLATVIGSFVMITIFCQSRTEPLSHSRAGLFRANRTSQSDYSQTSQSDSSQTSQSDNRNITPIAARPPF